MRATTLPRDRNIDGKPPGSVNYHQRSGRHTSFSGSGPTEHRETHRRQLSRSMMMTLSRLTHAPYPKKRTQSWQQPGPKMATRFFTITPRNQKRTSTVTTVTIERDGSTVLHKSCPAAQEKNSTVTTVTVRRMPAQFLTKKKKCPRNSKGTNAMAVIITKGTGSAISHNSRPATRKRTTP